MPRQNVDNTDIQTFRQKLEAFGRRQSQSEVANNPRKRRSSQTWEDVQREEMQFTEQWKDEVAFYPNKRRSIIPPQDCNQRSMSEITDFDLPSPVASVASSNSPYDNRASARMRITRDQCVTEYRDTNRYTMNEIKGIDQLLPSIETEDLDIPSFSSDTSSPWASEPRTPEGPYLEEDNSQTQSCNFVDIGSLMDVEQNLLAAFVPQQVPKPVYNDRFYADAIPGFKASEKSEMVGADFEAAFDEFMNVS